MRKLISLIYSVVGVAAGLAAVPASADGLSLLDNHLARATPERAPLALRAESDLVLYRGGVGVNPPAEGPMSWKDRRRAHRGSLMTAFGVPALATGIGFLAWSSVLPETNGCGEPRSRRPFRVAGLTFTSVGLTFSSAGLAALLRSSDRARGTKSRKTRTLTGLSAFAATLIGAGAAIGIGIGTAFCST